MGRFLLKVCQAGIKNQLPVLLSAFHSNLDLWWNAKQRKPAHGPRKQYKKRCRKERKSSKEKQTVTRAQFEGRET